MADYTDFVLGEDYTITVNNEQYKFTPYQYSPSATTVFLICTYSPHNFYSKEWPAYIKNNRSYYTSNYINKDISSTNSQLLAFYNGIKDIESSYYKYGIYMLDENEISTGSTFQDNYIGRAFDDYMYYTPNVSVLWTGTYAGYSLGKYMAYVVFGASSEVYQDDATDYYTNPCIIPIFNMDYSKVDVDSNNNITIKKSTPIYLGNSSNKAVDISGASKIYIGNSYNQARQINKIYIGNSNNKSTLIYG